MGRPRPSKNDEFLASRRTRCWTRCSARTSGERLAGGISLLTGRHGLFNSYEAFIRNCRLDVYQHAKWLKVCLELPWRRKISSAELSALASHGLAAGSQWLPRIRTPGFSRPRYHKGRYLCGSNLPPMPIVCCRGPLDQFVCRRRNYVNVCGLQEEHALAPQWLSNG